MKCLFEDFDCLHDRKCSGSTRTVDGNISEWACPQLQKYRDRCQKKSHNMRANIDYGFLYFNVVVIMAMIIAIFICQRYPGVVLLLIISVALFTFNAIWMNRNLIKLKREIVQLRKERKETEIALTLASRDRD